MAGIRTWVAQMIASGAIARVRSAPERWRRKLSGRAPEVLFFYDPTDPYSRLSAALLDAFKDRYRIKLKVYRAPPPSDAAAPERGRLGAWSDRDMVELAQRLRLPTDGRDYIGPFASDADGGAMREKLGHYLGATFYYEGDWYWGLDRLHFLEKRLRAEGFDRSSDAPDLAPVADVSLKAKPRNGAKPLMKFYFSFRSPYSYLAVDRVRRLAAHYGADLSLRYILPMVMRGLPVPTAKQVYIVRDCAREAARTGQPFGRIVDPVGQATEQALAVLHRAIGTGKEYDFTARFFKAVWAEGVDAKPVDGLISIAASAGLDEAFVRSALIDDSWRAAAEQHRKELFALGLWGAPTVQINDNPARWGQDRLWAAENDLIAATDAA